MSKTIAGLIGPALVALVAALLVNPYSIPTLIEPVSHDPALVLVSGVLPFVAGLAVVRMDNHRRGWAVLVTVFGWLPLVAGLVGMLFLISLSGMVANVGKNTELIATEAIVLLGIAAFLARKAYMSAESKEERG